LPTTGKILEKVILKIVQGHIEERGMLNASQIGFRACHSPTLQCMRLADHVTINFNNNMSASAVFLNIEKAYNRIWHLGSTQPLNRNEYQESSWGVKG
jgi:hypothetical protein